MAKFIWIVSETKHQVFLLSIYIVIFDKDSRYPVLGPQSRIPFVKSIVSWERNLTTVHLRDIRPRESLLTLAAEEIAVLDF